MGSDQEGNDKLSGKFYNPISLLFYITLNKNCLM
jgi:hypothetical protein